MVIQIIIIIIIIFWKSMTVSRVVMRSGCHLSIWRFLTLPTMSPLFLHPQDVSTTFSAEPTYSKMII